MPFFARVARSPILGETFNRKLATPRRGRRSEPAAGEVGAALAVVGLSAERAAKEAPIRDEMIRVAHRAGASLRQLAEVSGLDRKTVTAIVGATEPAQE